MCKIILSSTILNILTKFLLQRKETANYITIFFDIKRQKETSKNTKNIIYKNIMFNYINIC